MKFRNLNHPFGIHLANKCQLIRDSGYKYSSTLIEPSEIHEKIKCLLELEQKYEIELNVKPDEPIKYAKRVLLIDCKFNTKYFQWHFGAPQITCIPNEILNMVIELARSQMNMTTLSVQVVAPAVIPCINIDTRLTSKSKSTNITNVNDVQIIQTQSGRYCILQYFVNINQLVVMYVLPNHSTILKYQIANVLCVQL